MAIVLMIFTPCVTTIISSTLSILSINLGVLGSLTYWDIDLDPISMATILMAIGFSVDFIAHITFHYYKGQTRVCLISMVPRVHRSAHAFVLKCKPFGFYLMFSNWKFLALAAYQDIGLFWPWLKFSIIQDNFFRRECIWQKVSSIILEIYFFSAFWLS